MAMFVMISATAFGQFNNVHNASQVWNNTPTNTTGGVQPLLLNATTNRMELPGFESDSSRNYTAIGRSYVYIKYPTRDTVSLVAANFAINQIARFIVTASGADTTVFVPTTGRINNANYYVNTGTNSGVTIIFDGAYFWTTK